MTTPAPHKPQSSIKREDLVRKVYRLEKKRKEGGFSWKFAAVIFLLMIFSSGVVAVAGVYYFYLKDLPPIQSIENQIFRENTVFYDRKWNELYSLYSGEKRTYVAYDAISKHIRDAIISTEDKTFFVNPGIDLKALVRSFGNFAIGRTDKIQATSTISQQLIKNVFLSNERSIQRKGKEIFLSYQMNTSYSKEKILELYLNKIPFGNNAYGIEEAAKTYFGKSAKDVGVLGSTILASIPKGPTYYSPYLHRDRLMGFLSVHKKGFPNDVTQIDTKENKEKFAPLIAEFKRQAAGFTYLPDIGDRLRVCNVDQKYLKSYYIIRSGCVNLDYSELLLFLNNIQIPTSVLEMDFESGSLLSWHGEDEYVLEYNTGRKDFVAGRLFEDGKISGDDYRAVVLWGLDFEFVRYKEKIKYPHFVFYVKEYLETKYDKDFDSQWGLRIYTTIDPELQDKAEEIVRRTAATNRKQFGARDAALISMDNKTGQLMAMVGGTDYFNMENDGNVNITTSKRQPGSSFKPIVYALGISKEPIGPETPIYDVPTKFGAWEPDNYDKQFLGKMSIRRALDYSRNIPAIKMFYMAGWEKSVVDFAQSIGIKSLGFGKDYGAPLAIGTGELKALELMQAYSVFANGGGRRDVTPILKIVDKKGNVIEQYMDAPPKSVFSEAASYIISTILSDPTARPNEFWNKSLTLKDRPVAVKTGTSNKDVSRGKKKEILPRDLWTAGYTPQITTVVWAGNVDGSETKGTCDGLNCAAPIWQEYMQFAHKKLPKEEFKKPQSLFTATISKMSGKLASENTPQSLRVTTIFAVKPTAYESSYKMLEVDSLCNGKVTQYTPKNAIKQGYLLDVNPIIDSYDPKWLAVVRWWMGNTNEATKKDLDGANIITSYKDEPCIRPNADLSNVLIDTNLENGKAYETGRLPLRVRYVADNPAVKIQILADGKLLKEQVFETEAFSGTYETTVDIDESYIGSRTFVFRVFDRYYYSGESSVTVNFVLDRKAPTIEVTNPVSKDISIYENQYFNLRYTVTGFDEISASNVYVDGNLVKILGGGAEFSTPINDDKLLQPGEHTLRIEVIDALKRKARKDVKITILKE